MKSIIEEFSDLLGLSLNLYKSEVFLSGVNEQQGLELCKILGIKRGYLPVKYLCVSLISTKLFFKDCSPIIEKIKRKIEGWSNKLLTYVSRLQLVKSALLSIQLYWSSIFLLPRAVIKRIEAMLTAFLWKGVNSIKNGIKVCWKEMSKPIKQEGLGLPNLTNWNKALLFKYIWHIALKKESLWIAWVHTVELKNKCFWSISLHQSCSLVWHKFLQIKSIIQPFIASVIKSGENTYLWYDN